MSIHNDPRPRAKKLFRVHLNNVQTNGAMCGYGSGRTHEDAIADAVAKARERDPHAYYCRFTDTVKFKGGINS